MPSPPTSPYRRPQTPIPPFSPPSLPVSTPPTYSRPMPTQSRLSLLKQAQHHPTSFLYHVESPHPSPTDVGVLRTGGIRGNMGEEGATEGAGQERRGGDGRDGSGFDTLKSDFEFFFEPAKGSGEQAPNPDSTADVHGTPPLDDSPSTTHWDSPELPETELPTDISNGRGLGRRDALGAVVDTGLGFDFQVKVDPASPPALAQEPALHDVPVYTLAVPPPMLERAGSATSSDRPLSGYSSSGCDGDVSASDRGDQSADEEDEGDDEAYEVDPASSSPIHMVREGIPLFTRQRKRTEGDVTDEMTTSSDSEGGTLPAGSGDETGGPSSSRRRRVARLKRMEREDYSGKGYPYESDRPDYRKECLDVESEMTTTSLSEYSDHVEDESDIADISLSDLLALHPVSQTHQN